MLAIYFLKDVWIAFALIEARPIVSSRPQLDLIQDPQYRRNKSTVDMNTALHLYNTDKYTLIIPTHTSNKYCPISDCSYRYIYVGRDKGL